MKDIISLYVDGVFNKKFNCMMEALTYVHENFLGHKITFKTERVSVLC